NSDGSGEQVIGSDAVWNSISLSPNGVLLAATTTLQDSSIYIFDFSENNNNKKIRLYSPTTQEGVRNYTTVLADAMDWNLSGDYLIFDSFTSIAKAGGSRLEYWTINVLDPANEIIYLLFPPQPEGVSIGNPSFGQTNDIYFLFDYIDETQGIYQVRSANLYTGELFLVEDNGSSIGYPRYSPNDRKLVFQRWRSAGLNQIPTLRQISLKESKTEPAGSSTEYVTEGMLPSWFAIGERPTTVEISSQVQPTDFLLAQNYPNPFNPSTKISYSIPLSGFVTLKVYDIAGREVQTLVHEFRPAGSYTFEFDGGRMASGVYFYRLQVGDRFSEIKKMIHLK
ncbi:MAG TPA: T9SS type A sorting domain-containing protein, partial [bacterium]